MHLCCKVDGVWLFNLFVPVCPKHTRDIPASIWHIAYQIFSKKTMHIKSYILMVQHFTVHPQCMLPSAVVFALWKVLKKMKLIKWGFLQCADGNLHACGTKLNVLALWNGAVAFVVVTVDVLSASIFSEIEVIQWNPEEMAVGTNAPATLASTLRFWPILAFCCLQSCVRHVSVATSNSRRLGLMQPWWACIGVPGQIPLPGICLFMFVWNRDSSGFYLAAISFVGHLPWCDGELFEKSHISCRAKAFKGPVASLQHVQNQNKARLSFAKEIDTCARMLLGFRVESSGFDVRAIWWGICSTLIRDPPYISSIVFVITFIIVIITLLAIFLMIII